MIPVPLRDAGSMSGPTKGSSTQKSGADNVQPKGVVDGRSSGSKPGPADHLETTPGPCLGGGMVDAAASNTAAESAGGSSPSPSIERFVPTYDGRDMIFIPFEEFFGKNIEFHGPPIAAGRYTCELDDIDIHSIMLNT